MKNSHPSVKSTQYNSSLFQKWKTATHQSNQHSPTVLYSKNDKQPPISQVNTVQQFSISKMKSATDKSYQHSPTVLYSKNEKQPPISQVNAVQHFSIPKIKNSHRPVMSTQSNTSLFQKWKTATHQSIQSNSFIFQKWKQPRVNHVNTVQQFSIPKMKSMSTQSKSSLFQKWTTATDQSCQHNLTLLYSKNEKQPPTSHVNTVVQSSRVNIVEQFSIPKMKSIHRPVMSTQSNSSTDDRFVCQT